MRESARYATILHMGSRLLLFPIFGLLGWAAPGDCDRGCLKTLLDQYLNAVIKHDPAAAPLFAGFRQTENAVVVRPGSGLWKSVTGLGQVQRRYFDAVSGQAGYFGTIEEDRGAAIVTLRLKVEQRRISEAEWLIARKGDPGLNGPVPAGQAAGNFFDPDNLAKEAPAERTVPKAERLSREALIAITNSYFDGLTTRDGSLIIAHPGCKRVENGATVTGRPLAGGGGVSDCTSNLTNFSVQLVAARRYPVVDEEAGVVLGLGVFIRRPGVATRRNELSEWFVVDKDKIRSIYSAMFYPAPELPVPNWPPYEGNWPLPAALAAETK